MGVAGGLHLTLLLEAFPGILPEGLEQTISNTVRTRLRQNKRLVDQASEDIECVRTSHRSRRGQIESTIEHREPSKEVLLGRLEKLIAPVNGA
jgi:hypothetical protein